MSTIGSRADRRRAKEASFFRTLQCCKFILYSLFTFILSFDLRQTLYSLFMRFNSNLCSQGLLCRPSGHGQTGGVQRGRNRVKTTLDHIPNIFNSILSFFLYQLPALTASLALFANCRTGAQFLLQIVVLDQHPSHLLCFFAI